MKIVFVVGIPDVSNSSVFELFQNSMKEEIQTYGDILLVDIQDTYMNITWKVLALYEYFLTYCTQPKVKYFFKGDDDTYLNPINIMKKLGELDTLRGHHTNLFIYGAAFINVGPVRDKGNCQVYF